MTLPQQSAMVIYSLLLVGALCYVSYLCGDFRRRRKMQKLALTQMTSGTKYRLIEHGEHYRTQQTVTEKQLMEAYVAAHQKPGVALTLSRVDR